MEKEEYILLLSKAFGIIEKYDMVKSLEENFNIFEILNLEEREVELHSKLLFFLLNNKEKNNIYEKFFKYFLEIVLKEKYEADKEYRIYREYAILGGRIDFYIESEDIIYAIEMKINSIDGEEQLKKYNDFLCKKEKKTKLYYLTLLGEDPTKAENQEIGIISLSFKENVVDWLKKCIEKSYNFSLTRETLKQYLYSVNKLTNNIQEEGKEMELKTLLRENKNFRVASELIEAVNSLKEELEMEFWEELKEKISYDGEKIINPFNNGIELLFYKDINLEENLLCFGLGRWKGSGIYFLIGTADKETDEWTTKVVLNKNENIKNKFENFEKEENERSNYKRWGANWRETNIPNTNFNTDDIYILIEKDKEVKKEKLMEEIIDYFNKKHELINQVFLSEK